MNKINRQHILPLFIILAVFSMLISCNKEIDEPLTNANFQTKTNTPMLVFENEMELYATLDKIEQFTSIEELAQYEARMGYSSVGCIADQFLDNIDFSSYNSIEDFYNDMNAHANLVEVEYEPNSVVSYVPKFFHDRCRYVANIDGMYQVGENVTRLFTSGKVVTNISNMKELLSLTDSNIANIVENPNFSFEPAPTRIYIESNAETAPTDDSPCNYWIPNLNKIYYNENDDMRIYAEYQVHATPNTPLDVMVHAYCKMRHCIFGLNIWTRALRHIEFEGKSEFHYHRYLGYGTAYSPEWCDSISMISQSCDGLRTYASIYRGPYYASEYGLFHNHYSPRWDEIVEFQRVTMAVHSASVTLCFMDPLSLIDDLEYYLYLIQKYY